MSAFYEEVQIKTEIDNEESEVHQIESIFIITNEYIKQELNNEDCTNLSKYDNSKITADSYTTPIDIQVKKEEIDSDTLCEEVLIKPEIIIEEKLDTKEKSHKKRFKTDLLDKINENLWQCSICGASFEKRSNGTQHVKIHVGGKPFGCNQCLYRSIRKTSLVRHMRTHTGEKPFQCNVCDYRSSLKSLLNRHLKIHSDGPFKCDECEYLAQRKGHLDYHKKIHIGKLNEIVITEDKSPQKINVKNIKTDVVFRCALCEYFTHRKSNLEVHVKHHTGEKPFKCKICSRAFSTDSNLRGHMTTHTGEKPFKCWKCDYKSSRRTAVRRHIKSMHSSVASSD